MFFFFFLGQTPVLAHFIWLTFNLQILSDSSFLKLLDDGHYFLHWIEEGVEI